MSGLIFDFTRSTFFEDNNTHQKREDGEQLRLVVEVPYKGHTHYEKTNKVGNFKRQKDNDRKVATATCSKFLGEKSKGKKNYHGKVEITNSNPRDSDASTKKGPMRKRKFYLVFACVPGVPNGEPG